MRVSLTERVSIETAEAVVDEQRFPGRQGRLVFAYLLAEQGRPVPRGELAEALWGEVPPATWEKALSVIVSKLRSLLNDCGLDGSESLTSAFGCYQLTLPSGTWIDVLAADEAVSAAELALAAGDVERAREEASTAESLARRTFLPGEDARWVEEKRAELRETLVRALDCLAVAHRLGGDTRAAVRAAEDLVELEPFRERGYRLLMEAQSAAGNDAEALRTYERCRRLLADELGTYPSSETEAIYRRLLEEPMAAADTATVSASPGSPILHEPRRKKRRSLLLVAGSLVLAAGVAIAAVQLSEGRSAETTTLQTLESARCSALHYEGPGSPERLIAVDLPLQPGVRGMTTPMVNAITMQLERRKYTAGRHTVGLQVCDDATRSRIVGDERVCAANARMYVGNPSVIGVVGPLTSGCAMIEIPILNRASGGPVPLASPSATVVELTQRFRGSNPDALYPSGQRNFARILPTDDVHAAASALVARKLGIRRVYALDAGEAHSAWFVDDFVSAARRLGIAVVGRGSWDRGGYACPQCAGELSNATVAAAAARAGADGVFLGIPSFPASVRLLSALRARLGPDVQLMAPEAFDPATALLAGAAAEGMTITQPGPLHDDLPGSGKRFVASFRERFGTEPSRFAVAAAQAIDVLLDAIARSDGSRASVTRNLFATRASDRIFRNFWITPTGDSTLNAVAVYRIAGGKVTPFETVLVPDALVAMR